MKTLIAMLALLFTLQMGGQNTFDTPALKEQIKELDMAHAMAIFEGNATALDSLMSDDVTVNHPTNRIVNEKKELLELIKTGTIRYTSFSRTPEKFLFYENMVVVMGSELVVPAKGAPNAEKELTRRYTNIWMRNAAGKWQLAVRHAHNVGVVK